MLCTDSKSLKVPGVRLRVQGSSLWHEETRAFLTSSQMNDRQHVITSDPCGQEKTLSGPSIQVEIANICVNPNPYSAVEY